MTSVAGSLYTNSQYQKKTAAIAPDLSKSEVNGGPTCREELA